MPKYRESFKLDTQDIEMIEAALRGQIAANATAPREPGQNVRELQSLLGKIHEQKIFFSQANLTHHPRG